MQLQSTTAINTPTISDHDLSEMTSPCSLNIGHSSSTQHPTTAAIDTVTCAETIGLTTQAHDPLIQGTVRQELLTNRKAAQLIDTLPPYVDLIDPPPPYTEPEEIVVDHRERPRERTSIHQRYVQKREHVDEKIEKILDLMKNDENRKLITKALKEKTVMGAADEDQYLMDFKIKIIEPKSTLHAIATIVFPIANFGRFFAFVIEEGSNQVEVAFTIIGSLSTGVIELDGVSALPGSLAELKSTIKNLPTGKKVVLAVMAPWLGAATGSDIARVFLEAKSKHGIPLSAFCAACEGLTIIGVGGEATHLLAGGNGENREKCLPSCDPHCIVDKVISTGCKTNATLSGYSFPFRVEQWTNRLFDVLLSPRHALTIQAEIIKGVIMIPHALVLYLIESTNNIIFWKSIKNSLLDIYRLINYTKKIKEGCIENLTESELGIEKKIYYLLRNFESLSDTVAGRKMLCAQLLGLSLTALVAGSALYTNFLYQTGLSNDTDAEADRLRDIAQNITQYNSTGYPGVDPRTVSTMADWANIDAILNRVAVLSTEISYLVASFGLPKMLGMFLGTCYKPAVAVKNKVMNCFSSVRNLFQRGTSHPRELSSHADLPQSQTTPVKPELSDDEALHLLRKYSEEQLDKMISHVHSTQIQSQEVRERNITPIPEEETSLLPSVIIHA